jgi:glucose-6-phosphate isomerase
MYMTSSKSSSEKKYRDHLAVITDPKGGILRKIADSEGMANLPIPPEVGGRYSTLTPVGLLPSAFSE